MFTHSFALPLHYPLSSLPSPLIALSVDLCWCDIWSTGPNSNSSSYPSYIKSLSQMVSFTCAIESNQNPPGNLSLWTSCVTLSRFRYPHPFFPPSLSSATNHHYHQRLLDIAVLRRQLKRISHPTYPFLLRSAHAIHSRLQVFFLSIRHSFASCFFLFRDLCPFVILFCV